MLRAMLRDRTPDAGVTGNPAGARALSPNPNHITTTTTTNTTSNNNTNNKHTTNDHNTDT